MHSPTRSRHADRRSSAAAWAWAAGAAVGLGLIGAAAQVEMGLNLAAVALPMAFLIGWTSHTASGRPDLTTGAAAVALTAGAILLSVALRAPDGSSAEERPPADPELLLAAMEYRVHLEREAAPADENPMRLAIAGGSADTTGLLPPAAPSFNEQVRRRLQRMDSDARHEAVDWYRSLLDDDATGPAAAAAGWVSWSVIGVGLALVIALRTAVFGPPLLNRFS